MALEYESLVKPSSTLPDGSQISVVGLSFAYSSNERAIARRYLHHVSDRYAKLPKYAEFSVPKRRTELEVVPELIERTAVIVNTLDQRILGGVMVVLSHTPNEKMPFQNSDAFKDFKRPLNESGAAEVGRLTAPEDGSIRDLFRAKNMILLALRYIADDPNMTHVYVHTSAAHARLYRMMGFQPHTVLKHDHLNYLLVYDRKEVDRHLRENSD